MAHSQSLCYLRFDLKLFVAFTGNTFKLGICVLTSYSQL